MVTHFHSSHSVKPTPWYRQQIKYYNLTPYLLHSVYQVLLFVFRINHFFFLFYWFAWSIGVDMFISVFSSLRSYSFYGLFCPILPLWLSLMYGFVTCRKCHLWLTWPFSLSWRLTQFLDYASNSEGYVSFRPLIELITGLLSSHWDLTNVRSSWVFIVHSFPLPTILFSLHIIFLSCCAVFLKTFFQFVLFPAFHFFISSSPWGRVRCLGCHDKSFDFFCPGFSGWHQEKWVFWEMSIVSKKVNCNFQKPLKS